MYIFIHTHTHRATLSHIHMDRGRYNHELYVLELVPKEYRLECY